MMNPVAHSGTLPVVHASLLAFMALLWISCDDENATGQKESANEQTPADRSPQTDADASGTPPGAWGCGGSPPNAIVRKCSEPPECNADSECTLVPRSCCICEATFENMIAVSIDNAASWSCDGGVTCEACPTPLDPSPPIFTAICRNHYCQAVRDESNTVCMSDAGCAAAQP